MRTIAIASQKGGTGKTTSTLALGTLLAQRGRRVLIVDMDPQASLSISCGVDGLEASVADVLVGKKTLAKILWEVSQGFFLAPSDISLSQAELVLVGKLGRENVLKRALASVAELLKLDYCLIDCPPSLNLLTVNGLVAAGEVLIPTRPEFLGRRALVPLMETIEEVKQNLNSELKILGILPTFWNPRTRHHAEVIQHWQEEKLPVLDIRIGQTIRAAEAPTLAKSITDYAPQSQVAQGYRDLVEFIDSAP
jgi:chromosome partitioning protein